MGFVGATPASGSPPPNTNGAVWRGAQATPPGQQGPGMAASVPPAHPPVSAWQGAPAGAPPGASGAGTNPDNNLMTAGNAEKFYGQTSGQYQTPSYTEQLVQQGIGGHLNDYYEFERNKLHDQFASMGGANSGALLRADQELGSNQAHDMEQLAQAGDQMHYGRLTNGQNAAASADNGKLGRLGLTYNAALGLGTNEASIANGFYTNASNTANPFNAEQINAGVQASTINPGSAMFHDALNIAGAGVKAYYGGQGGGAK